jgi:hypothetical protein
MNSSRQSDTNSEARYGAYGNNYNMRNGSNNYPNVIPHVVVNGSNAYSNYGGNYGGYYDGQEKAYTIVNTQPITVKKNQPIVLVDPILEPHVKSYMTWSLLNVFCCCLIGGIITTIMSCNVMRLNDNKQFKEASRLSGKVLLANLIASGVGALLFIILFPYVYLAIYPSLPKINW